MRDRSEEGLAILGDLGSKISLIDDRDVIKITMLLEGGGNDPKALKGRAILRTRSRKLRPPRRLDALRLFCVPFEMLLSDEQSSTDPVRRIPRVAIWSLWPLLATRFPARVLENLEQQAASARSVRDEGLQQAAAALWAAAAKAIETNFDAMAAQVGEPHWLRDMAGAVQAHEAITKTRTLLKGGGLAKPGDALVQEVVGPILGALDLGEDAAFAATMVAVAHFRSPAAIIGALLSSGLATGRGQAVARRLCDALRGDMEREISSMQGHDETASPGAVVAGMSNLVDSLQTMQGFANQTKDSLLKLKVEQAMLAARSAAVDDMLPRMRNCIGNNLDRAVNELLSGQAVDSSREVESNMVALRQAQPSAEFLGAGKEVAGAVSDLLSTVKAKAEATPEAESDEDRTTRLMALARFVELLEGADAAQTCLNRWLMREAA